MHKMIVVHKWLKAQKKHPINWIKSEYFKKPKKKKKKTFFKVKMTDQYDNPEGIVSEHR